MENYITFVISVYFNKGIEKMVLKKQCYISYIQISLYMI